MGELDMRRVVWLLLFALVVLMLATPLWGQCTTPSTGLVGWWPGDGNATDIVGSSNGTAQGGVTFAPGKVGQAMSFNGTNQFVDLPAMNLGRTFSLEFWVQPTRTANYQHLISNSFSSANFGALYLRINHLEYWQGGTLQVTTPDSVPINAWSHVALTSDGSAVRIYVNGSLAGTNGALVQTFNNALRLGSSIPPESNFFQGLLDEVKLYNRALSAAEIQAIVNAGSGGNCKSAPFITAPATFPEGIGTGGAYSQALSAALGIPPYSFTLASGALPPGLNLSTTGVISGVPTTPGAFAFSAQVTDSAGKSSQRTYSISVFPCVSSPTGLVSWWPGDGNASDIVGTSNGTAQGGVTFAPGKVGQAMSFNGTNQFVDVPAMNLGRTFSLEFWVRPTRTANYQHLISNSFSSANFGALYLRINHLEYWQGGMLQVMTPDSVLTNAWSHVALTSDGSAVRIYVNGSLAGTNGALVQSFNNALRLGSSIPSESDFLQGLLDEVKLYNRALSAAEIQAIVNAGSGGNCKQRCPFDLAITGRVPTLCQGGAQPVDLTLTGSNLAGATITWTLDGTTTLGIGANLRTTLSGLSAGPHTISATATQGGCAVSTSTTFTTSQTTVSITGAPAGAICAGTAVSLGSNVTGGAGPFTYRWEKNGTVLPATAASLSDAPSIGCNTYTVKVTDASGCVATSAPVIVNVFDFTVSVSPSDQTVLIGGSTTYTVSAALAAGSAGAPAGVPLGISGLTAATTQGLPATLNFGSSASFSVQTTGATPLGDATFTVTGAVGACAKAATARLHTYDFAVNVAPLTQTILRGCRASFSVAVNLVPGSSTTGVPATALSVAYTGAAPAGVTSGFSIGLAPPPFTSTLTMSSTSSSSLGSFPFNVIGLDSRASAGGSRSSRLSSLDLYDFSLSASPSNLVLASNEEGGFTVTLTLAKDSAPAPVISLGASGLPADLTGTFDPALVAPTLAGASTNLIIRPASPATLLPAGSFSLKINGADPNRSCSRTADATLTVVAVALAEKMRSAGCHDLANGFDVIFTGEDDDEEDKANTLTLRATHPGAFSYNVLVKNMGSAESKVRIILDLPPNDPADAARGLADSSAFVLWGRRPVHVFAGDPCHHHARDITPHDVQVNMIAGGFRPQPLHNRYTSVASTSSIIIPKLSVPPGDTIWVRVQMRYALLRTTGWPSDSANTFVRSYQYRAHVAFDGHDLTNPIESEFTGTGKSVTGIGGHALDVNGAGKGGLHMVVDGTTVGENPASCANPNTTTQHATGFYFIPLPANTCSVVRLYNANCDQIAEHSFAALGLGQFVEIDFLDLDP
jgi:hypothetical protein